MKKLLFVFIIAFMNSVTAQVQEDAWIFLNDKPLANNYLNNPLSMLSQRALDRRTRLNIVLDYKDVPIDVNYLNQIKTANGITYLSHSKWLNAIHVQGSENDIRSLLNFNFVDYIEFANKNIGIVNRPQPVEINNDNSNIPFSNYDYGNGYEQIHMLNGELMHQQNYTGDNVLLAVIDAGFIDVDTDSFFQNISIVDVYNFVSNNQNVYQYSSHGTAVLSTIASNNPGQLVGTAPDIEVALYVSEDVSQEMPIEETFWARAAERADSLGVDVINTSLGYKTFDNSNYNYTINDLDGNTSFISRAANIAVSRGISVVVSAGNSGNSLWASIGMPADAEGVITVGAVDVNRTKAGFSSIGPTADGRIKPDVMALGLNASVYYNGVLTTSSGTSFSSPIIAGMVACMIQAYPNKTPAQIKQDLISISDRYANPDNEYGYGIPDFSQYQITNIAPDDEIEVVNFYPNPVENYIYTTKNTDYKIFTTDGKLVLSGKITDKKIDISTFNDGIYYFLMDKVYYKIIKK